MAVYTHVPAEAIADLLADYGLGALRSAKGIAEGVENSNYLVDATSGRYILTLYEKRVDAADLPFFMALLDHLADHGLPVPRALRDRRGDQVRMLYGRPACLIEFREGVSLSHPTPAQAHATGTMLGRMHAALADFGPTRPNHELAAALDHVERGWPQDGGRCVIHADLFPDNVLMLGNRVTGLIDFYFACTDLRLYDLAVAHTSWSFDGGGRYEAPVGRALLDGYADAFGLSADDRAQLPVLAMGACIRFALTRAWDWINTPADALVTRKDPLAYTRRLAFYRTAGQDLFA